MVDEEDVGAFAFAQKDRLLFRRGQTTATTQTKPGRQFSAGLCVPDSMDYT